MPPNQRALEVLALLGEHGRRYSVGKASVYDLGGELEAFRTLLETAPGPVPRVKRPPYPGPGCKPLYNYKRKLCAYLGYKTESLSMLTWPLLEATADYLEARREKNNA